MLRDVEHDIRPGSECTIADLARHVESGGLLSAEHERYLAGHIQAGLAAYDSLHDNFSVRNPAEKRAIRQEIRDGTQARQTLFEGNTAFAYAFAKKFMPSGLVDEDVLVQDGLLGIWQATEKFTSNHPSGARFLTYAGYHMFSNISRSLAEHGRPGMRYPIHVGEAGHEYWRCQSELRQQLGREPAPDEILEAVVPKKRRAAAVLRVVQIVPLESGRGYGTSREFTGQEEVPLLKKDPIERLVGTDGDLAESVVDKVVLEGLYTMLVEGTRFSDSRGQLIVDMRLGFTSDDGMPVVGKEVGEVFGISPERVRQIESRALAEMRANAIHSDIPSPRWYPSDHELDEWVQKTQARRDYWEQQTQAAEARKQERAERRKAGPGIWSSRLGKVAVAELTAKEQWQLGILERGYHTYRQVVGRPEYTYGYGRVFMETADAAELATSIANAVEAWGDETQDQLDGLIRHAPKISPTIDPLELYPTIVEDARKRFFEAMPDPRSRLDLLEACREYLQSYTRDWLAARLDTLAAIPQADRADTPTT
jgi:RNA polymerase primary sigma factor